MPSAAPDCSGRSGQVLRAKQFQRRRRMVRQQNGVITMIRNTILAAAAAVALGSGGALAGSHAAAEGDLVDVAAEAGGFETLIAAVQAAGLEETLRGDGPFTVFAPTDEAFAALPEGTLESLLDEANRDQLVAILTYHVVPGAITSSDLAGQSLEVETVNGQTVDIDATSGVTVDGATVVQPDITASNGVIHVIDRVILPN
jgi:uncharacterized surface protein with fasciclin (FAS1) repeats